MSKCYRKGPKWYPNIDCSEKRCNRKCMECPIGNIQIALEQVSKFEYEQEDYHEGDFLENSKDCFEDFYYSIQRKYALRRKRNGGRYDKRPIKVTEISKEYDICYKMYVNKWANRGKPQKVKFIRGERPPINETKSDRAIRKLKDDSDEVRGHFRFDGTVRRQKRQRAAQRELRNG